MHKDFYASGFLYHLPSQQILLQQKSTVDISDTSSLWTLFGGQGYLRENPEATFQRVVNKLLRIKVSLTNIYPIYTYFYKEINQDHAVVYAEVENMQEFSSLNKIRCAWFTMKQILKLDISQQTKQDVTVGQRVIDSRMRKSLGLQTLE